MTYRLLLPAVLLGALGVAPTPARAQAATFGLSAGATQLEESGEAAWHPTVRAEIAFRAVGPLALGAFVDGVAAELPFTRPGFGAGALAQLRARAPVLGVVPHVEALVARLQLPSERQGRVDAWSASLGAGLGLELDSGVVLEARFRRSWYHVIDAEADVEPTSWTLATALVLELD